MTDRLRYRGKLTVALATEFESFVSKKPKVPVGEVHVSFYNERDDLLARVPFVEALRAVALDLSHNDMEDWKAAIDVELDAND